MEQLLAHSFDYLSSCEHHKIRKGLRQVEGLMAQICLRRDEQQYMRRQQQQQQQQQQRQFEATAWSSSPPPLSPPPPSRQIHGAKSMEELSHDPAFLEWFKLQDSFQYNVTTNLLACLSNILSLPPSAQLDKLILSTLDVVQGTLLLHPPSRALFAREINMNLLLDLLEPTNSPQVQIATLFTLVSACMCHPASTRCFEELDGLLTITSLFKLRATRKEVKVRLVEFLYFYLMPESPRERGGSSSSSRRGSGRGSDQGRGSSGIDETTRNCIDGTTTGNGSGSVGSGSGRGSGRSNKSSISTRCTRTLEEKKLMLGKYLNNVDDLVADLRETIPFGNG